MRTEWLFMLLLTSLLLSACGGSSQAPSGESPLPHAMKGYELYSWLEEGNWRFTLITGTNRLKTYEEITSGEDTVTEDGWVSITVRGVDALKTALGRLPEGEEVFWRSGAGEEMEHFPLPNEGIMDGIKAHCEQSGVKLHIV